jgi:hypothetical protein
MGPTHGKYERKIIMDNIKKIAKYTTNILAIINALLLGLEPIWNIPYTDKIAATITVIIGVIGTYLLGNKAKSVYDVKKGK